MPNPLDEANYRPTTTSRGTVLIPRSISRVRGGLWLYGSTRPRALAAHLAAGALARISARAIAPRNVEWTPPVPREELEGWLASAQSHLGVEISHLVVQLPSDTRRRRFSLLLMDQDNQTCGFVKFTMNPQNELAVAALETFRSNPPQGYWAPALIDAGRVGQYNYVMTTPMPNHAHLPARLSPTRRREIILDLQGRLRRLVDPPGLPVHGDFGVWNVRSFLNGGLAILDWETVTSGVEAADELWHVLSMQSVRRSRSVERTVMTELQHHTTATIADAARFWLKMLSRPEPPEIDQGLGRSPSLADDELELRTELQRLSQLT